MEILVTVGAGYVARTFKAGVEEVVQLVQDSAI